MHELPVVNTILETVLRHARKNNATGVRTIYLKIGRLSDLEDQWMQDFFDYVSKDTIAEGAKLEIERTPIGMMCDGCGTSYTLADPSGIDRACPHCGQETVRLVSGREYLITNLEIMMPADG